MAGSHLLACEATAVATSGVHSRTMYSQRSSPRRRERVEAVASRLLLSEPPRRSPVAVAAERFVNRDVIDEKTSSPL